MTVRTRSTIDTNISTNFADNTSQAITAALLRANTTDINDSSAFQTIQQSGNVGGISGVLTIDLNYPVQYIQPTGTPVAGFVNINTTSRSATISSLTKVIFLPPNTDVYITGWNGNWNWLGSKPSGIFAHQAGILTLCSFGVNESNILAAWTQCSSG
jgi:hypothetical protein